MDASPQSSGRLTWTRNAHRGGSVVRLKGVIDESFDRQGLVAGLTGTVVFDLEGVQQITSFGVREWINALRELKANEVVFINARPALMTQFNSVAHFGGPGQLVTFFAPYVCEQCGDPHETLVDLRGAQAEQVRGLHPPEVRCPKCQVPLDFDDIPEMYFSYVSQQRPPNLSPVAVALVDGHEEPAAPTSTKFRLDKEVVDTVTALWLAGPMTKVGRLKRALEGCEGEVVMILQEAEPPSAEDAGQLALLINSTSVPVHLARVPVQLIHLWATSGIPANARILSLHVSFACPQCGNRLPLEAHTERLRTGVGRRCPVDGQDMQIELPAKDRQMLASVLVRPPASVANYLAGHSFPPRRELTPSNTPTGVLNTPLPKRGGPSPAVPQDDRHFGRYEIIRPLGRGGMAEVFLARQLSLGGFAKTVVLKRILAQLSDDQKFVEMFLQEARLAARISHPNVVEIFDVGQVGNQYFIAMEFVKGTDLSRLLQTATRLNEPMPVELAARVVADVAAGLHAAHSCVNEHGQPTPIIHRDVSPHNVLISMEGQVKLTDFGIAKATDSGERTPTHTIKGKLGYLAPEQVRAGMGPIDTRADLFPLGLIFYQCATLEQMFRRDTEYATLWALLNDPIKKLTDHRPAPALADAVLGRTLARNPAQRYQTARGVHHDLESVIAATGRPGTNARLAEWIRHIYELAKSRQVSTFGAELTGSGSRPNALSGSGSRPNALTGSGSRPNALSGSGSRPNPMSESADRTSPGGPPNVDPLKKR